MTLIVTYTRQDTLECYADTRVSGGEQILTDSATKGYIVAISYTSVADVERRKMNNYTLGCAFCGSALLSQNTHAIASTCTQMIHTNRDEYIPTAEDIAKIYARVGEHVCRDYNSRLREQQTFAALVFGYCPVLKQLITYKLSPIVEAGGFKISIDKYDSTDGQIVGIGSGTAEFNRQLGVKNSIGGNRNVFDVFMSVVKQGKVKSVGGYPQIIIANANGVEVVPIVAPDDDNPDVGGLRINGFDVKTINHSAPFVIGVRGRGVGTEKILGRKALRAQGLDPDLPVARETQNAASFALAVRDVFGMGGQLTLSEAFTLDAPRPEINRWYYSGTCRCGLKAPIVEDPSSGTKAMFTGPGKITTRCVRCGSEFEACAAEIVSLPWQSS